MKAVNTKFRLAVKRFNEYCEEKYKRPFWKNISNKNFILHETLGNALIDNWSLWGNNTNDKNQVSYFLESNRKNIKRQPKRFNIYTENDISSIVKELLSGKLIVIPNSKIYVIFGIDYCDTRNQCCSKINSDKLRHLQLPIVRLGIDINNVIENITSQKVKYFLTQIVASARPIGLLVPTKLNDELEELWVFYPGNFMSDLASQIRSATSAKANIYVSSANLTTTGANTTTVGVIKDFKYSNYIDGILDNDDLKSFSNSNNSTTIIRCSKSGLLSYFRLGYPSKYLIDNIASDYGIEINCPVDIRETFAR